jgi:hypothetical protein
LSANVAELCLETLTGCLQALLLPATAPAMSSVLDTKIASNPLKDSDPPAERLDVRLA